EVGKGSRFHFTLPLATQLPLLPEPEQPRAAASRPVVLLVEDAGVEQRVIEAHLSRAGYAVTVAGSGEEALRLLPSLEPAGLVIDLGLPGLSGTDLISRVRAMPGFGVVP